MSSRHSRNFPKTPKTSSYSLPSHVRNSLENLSVQQTELADDRQQLLVDRQRIISSVRSVRTRREHVQDAEVQLINVFRKLYTSQDRSLQDDLVSAYSELEKKRDDLIGEEDRYTDIIHELELSEWALMEKEEDLYQRDIQHLLWGKSSDVPQEAAEVVAQSDELSTCSLSTSPEAMYQMALVDHRSTLRQLYDLTKRYIHEIDIKDLMLRMDGERSPGGYLGQKGLAKKVMALIDLMAESELKLVGSKAEISAQIEAYDTKAYTESSTLEGQLQHKGLHRQQRSSEISLQNADTSRLLESSVNEWILRCLMANINHKLQFMAILTDEMRLPGQTSTERKYFDQTVTQDRSFDLYSTASLPHTRSSSTTSLFSQRSFHISSDQTPALVLAKAFYSKLTSASHLQDTLNIPTFQVVSNSSSGNRSLRSMSEIESAGMKQDNLPGLDRFRFPALNVTAPMEEANCATAIAPDIGHLSATNACNPRCDSAQESDYRTRQCGQPRSQEPGVDEPGVDEPLTSHIAELTERLDLDMFNSENIEDEEFGMLDGIATLSSWLQSPFIAYQGLVVKKDTVILEKNTPYPRTHYISDSRHLRELDHEEFFTLGRVFQIDRHRDSMDDWAQRFRSSKGYCRQPCIRWFHAEFQQFIAVINKRSSSICVPIQSNSMPKVFMHYMNPVSMGGVYTDPRPPRPRSNDMYGAIPLHVILKDEENYPLPQEPRILYDQFREIEHNVELIEVGMVDDQHKSLLLNQFFKSTRVMAACNRSTGIE